MLAHIAAHVAMSSPASASAHIVAVMLTAEHASMHSCIIGISMPVDDAFGIALIMSIIVLIPVPLLESPSA
ncbi:hypothetical protein [Microbacterium marinilacus]